MATRVSIPTTSGDLEGVLAVPAGEAPRAAVVVVQEYWGITAQVESVVDRWAAEGFLAIAPDLYHGVIAKDAGEAGALMKALDFGRAVGEIAAAAQYVRTHPRSTGKVAVTGYCLGGALTFATAVNVPGFAAVVPFYGLPGDLDWSKIDAPIQAHFALHDDWATVAGAEQIKAAVNVPMELHVYDAQHAFCNDCRPEVYDPEAADLAWHRAVAFVRAHTMAAPVKATKRAAKASTPGTPGKIASKPRAKAAAKPVARARPKTVTKAKARPKTAPVTKVKPSAKTKVKASSKPTAKASSKATSKPSKATAKANAKSRAKPTSKAKAAGKRR